MPHIKIRGLNMVFGDLVAIDNLDLDVKKGEYLTILGPTGAGKTTLLRLISGLTEQTSGTIEINGKNIDALPPDQRRVAFLSQSYSLFPRMNVWENTTFGPNARGWDPERVETIGREMLEMVHLYERRDALPHELSGGMQQRNALARALSADAKVLLLDEPLRALDARLRLDLRYELKRLAKAMNMTTIHVTHDQEEALTISDRIIMLRDGKIIQSGTPQEMFNNPASPFIQHFIGEANFIKGTIKQKKNGGCIISDQIGREVMAEFTTLNQGDDVVAGIKTEYTILSSKREKEINTYQGTIDRKLFLGRFTDFEVLLAEGGIVHARLPSSLAHKFHEGNSVHVHYSPERMKVFPEPVEGLKKELEMM